MVREGTPGPHPPHDPGPAAPEDRAGLRRPIHALSLPLATPLPRQPPPRRGGPVPDSGAAPRVRGAGGILGNAPAQGPPPGLRAFAPGPGLPLRPLHLGTAQQRVLPGDAGSNRHADETEPLDAHLFFPPGGDGPLPLPPIRSQRRRRFVPLSSGKRDPGRPGALGSVVPGRPGARHRPAAGGSGRGPLGTGALRTGHGGRVRQPASHHRSCAEAGSTPPLPDPKAEAPGEAGGGPLDPSATPPGPGNRIRRIDPGPGASGPSTAQTLGSRLSRSTGARTVCSFLERPAPGVPPPGGQRRDSGRAVHSRLLRRPVLAAGSPGSAQGLPAPGAGRRSDPRGHGGPPEPGGNHPAREPRSPHSRRTSSSIATGSRWGIGRIHRPDYRPGPLPASGANLRLAASPPPT